MNEPSQETTDSTQQQQQKEAFSSRKRPLSQHVPILPQRHDDARPVIHFHHHDDDANEHEALETNQQEAVANDHMQESPHMAHTASSHMSATDSPLPSNNNKDQLTATLPTTMNTSNSMLSNDRVLRHAAGGEGEDNDTRTSKDYYFDSYSHHAIHEEMLKDEVRTRAFQMAILHNQHLFQNKIVLDVGCGTAILSMFAAQAGAKHVFGVDCSSIIDQAQQIVDRNGFSDRITLIKGKMEEIDLPVPHVDVIISEWMGYFLLYESMLDTVLYARDKWLVPKDGVIFPDKAIMYICGAEDAHVKTDRIDFWDNVYGFDMTPLKEIALKEPVVDVIDSRQIVTDTVPILRLDILTCTKEELVFQSNFTIHAQRNDCIHALVTYFECAFTQGHKPIGFSTSPFSRYTHWKQTLLYLREGVTVGEGEAVSGEISCKPNVRNRRDLDIGLVLYVQGYYYGQEQTRVQMNYRLR